MDDKELLERAAGAAALTLEESIYPGWFMCDGRQWNPLVDDGDALRLAVKLSVEIYIDEGTSTLCEESTSFRTRGIHTVCEDHVPGDFGQQCAATRRAIVRAAVEIGSKIDAPLVRADLEGL